MTADAISADFIRQRRDACRAGILSQLKALNNRSESGELERILGRDRDIVKQIFKMGNDETPEISSLHKRIDVCQLEIGEKDVKVTALERGCNAFESKMQEMKEKYNTL